MSKFSGRFKLVGWPEPAATRTIQVDVDKICPAYLLPVGKVLLAKKRYGPSRVASSNTYPSNYSGTATSSVFSGDTDSGT